MILNIKKYPHPILRKKCQDIKEITQEIQALGQDMIETMAKNNGAGLAAPQVGILKRLIVIQTEANQAALILSRRASPKGRGSGERKRAMVLINPKIIKKSRKQGIMEEGCISIPGLWLKIRRAEEIEVEALDKDGKKIKTKAEGLTSRVLQHEIDHLQGILFIDRLGLFQRLKVKKQLAKKEDL